MPKYENGLIYKLIHNDDHENTNIYIGSTTNFRMRKNTHKSNCNNINSEKYNCKVYQFIRDNGGWDEWVMIQLEAFPCNNEQELKSRERYYIESLKANLNCNIPNRTYKEWVGNNKEYISQWHKEFYKDNKVKIKEKNKEYRDVNKEHKVKIEVCNICGCNSTNKNLKRHQKSAKCQKAQELK